MSVKFTPKSKQKISQKLPAEKGHANFQEALALHQKGDLARAQIIYEEIIKKQPTNFDSLHLLGVLAYQNADYQRSVDLIKKAIQINPKNSIFYYNKGLAHQELRQLESAIDSFGKAIEFNPEYVDAHYNRGLTFVELGQASLAALDFLRVTEMRPDYADAFSDLGNTQKELQQFQPALKSYDKAIELDPNFVDAYYNKGLTHLELKNFGAAIESFGLAIKLEPNFPEAFCNRGLAYQAIYQWEISIKDFNRAIALRPNFAEAYSNRGLALIKTKQLEASFRDFDKAIELRPNFAEAYSNRGLVLKQLKQLEASVKSCDKAIQLKPNLAEAFCNRGLALQGLKQLEASIENFNQAIKLNPNFAAAYSNKSISQKNLKLLDEAIRSCDKAIKLNPKSADAYWNKALVLLLNGKLNEGWDLFEWRWKRDSFTSPKRDFSQPLWLGLESLKEKTILLHSEQGLGDTIQFCRYAKSVSQLGARVILEVPKALVSLFQSLEGISELISKGTELPAFDFHCPLLSLPLAFKTTETTIPSNKAYLHSEKNKVSRWEKRLGKKTKPRVGIVWSSLSSFRNDSYRSLKLKDFLAALPKSGIEYICLQKEIKEDDKETLASVQDIRFFGNELKDFSQTAALIENIDLVVSTCTSVPHLSGAMHKPTWLLLSSVPDWRWMLNRNDSPWYSSVRLYRQDDSRNWVGVLEQIKTDLGELFSYKNTNKS